MKTEYKSRNENLGLAIDRVDSLAHALTLKIPDALHVEALREALPEIVKELKSGFIEATGENPWD